MDSLNTIFIIIITSAISILAFNKVELFDKLKFNAYMIWHKKEYGRILSHGLIHGGWMHLGINMYVLYSFGSAVEAAFKDPYFFPNTYQYGSFMYLAMYIIAIAASSLIAIFRYKNNHSYNAVGASGAVSAVAFAFILLAPTQSIQFILLPFIKLPAYIFGVAYLAYSYYMSTKGRDNIAHEAHFAGAVFGIIFPLILNYKLVDYFFYIIFN